ncbi:MAG: sodium:alanine symporter family protein, partial [Lachnospiraceae bacterium]|nr:sodium:alanine symporter family protein [Candidatus Colinaster scatohippi]
NGLMMIPNLIGVLSLTPLVYKITNNYVERKIKGNDIAPILSYDASIQKEMEEAVRNGAE